MKLRLIYILVGVGLIIGMFSTRIKDIDKDTLDLIERAIVIDVENEFWPGYKLEDYPIDVNYGKVEFKYYQGEISKQKPSLDLLALSAYPEKDGAVIKIIPYSMVRKVIDMMGDMGKKERDDLYISIIFHEGLHAFQMENGLEYDLDKESTRYEKFINILYDLDNNEKYKEFWLEEQNSLLDYFENDNKLAWIKSYNKRMTYLKEILGEDFEFYMKMENERELIEGTARYVEDKVLETITGRFIELDIDSSYYTGEGKFYTTGRLKCLILDQGKAWKKDLFKENKSLTDLLI